jgi:hypothetical protein
MKLNYIGNIALSSKNVSFSIDNKLQEVPEEVGNYLIKTFPDLFEVIKEEKKEVKAVEKPKKAE